MLAAQHPKPGLPLRTVQTGNALDRKHEAGGRVEPALENSAEALAFARVAQPVVHRIDVDGQLALFLQIVNRIFEGGVHVLGIESQAARQRLGEMPRFQRTKVGTKLLLREQRTIVPQRHAIGAPDSR